MVAYTGLKIQKKKLIILLTKYAAMKIASVRQIFKVPPKFKEMSWSPEIGVVYCDAIQCCRKWGERKSEERYYRKLRAATSSMAEVCQFKDIRKVAR